MCELWFQEEKPQMSRGMTVGKSREGSGQGSWDLRQDPLLTDCLSPSVASSFSSALVELLRQISGTQPSP